jgi:methyl-accepting chemotaxis protein
MRFTVKAKLASAFGAVTILSMITGGVAYTKLTALDQSEQSLVTQAERMKKSSDLMNDVQGQLRSELRMILASSDKDNAELHREMMERQETSLKLKDELYGIATENGKRMIEDVTVKLKRMDELQQQAGKFALLNSSNRAAELWAKEGLPALRELNSAVDAASVEVNKAPGAVDNLRALLALQTAKYQAARLSRSITSTFTAPTVEELEAEY